MQSRVLFCALVLLVACSRQRPTPSAEKTRVYPSPRPSADVRFVPSSGAEILHEYQGLLQGSDGHSRWVVVTITRAEPHDGTITIDYNANGSGYRHRGTAAIDSSGNLTVENVRSHFARADDGRLIIESSAIGGPPFWRLVQTGGRR
jgi:hypothetical protein